jgi:prophage endopeptidase
MIFNPYFILGAILALIGVYSYGHHSGYQERVTEDEIEIARLNDEARTKEAELNKKVTQTAYALRKAKDEIATKQASINERIRAGELRLPSSCPVQTPADPGATPGDRDTHAAQSDRQAIEDIVAIAADGDRAIVQLNTCIDTYQKVREQINSQGR